MGFEDVGDPPTDGEDRRDTRLDTRLDNYHSRPSHEVHPYSDQTKFRQTSSRASPYAYPANDPSIRGNGAHDNRMAYDSSGNERVLQGSPPSASPHVGQPFTYVSTSSHTRQHNPIYGHNSASNNENWNLPSARPSAWLPPPEHPDRSYTPLVDAPRVHRPSTSPVWQRSSHSAGNSAASSLHLPTLSSPFYPQSSHQSPVPTSSQHTAPSSYNPGQMQPPILSSREYDDQEIALSPSISNPAHSYQSSAGRDGIIYSQRQSGAPRGLPSISNYSQSQTSQYTPSSNSAQGYWTRE